MYTQPVCKCVSVCCGYSTHKQQVDAATQDGFSIAEMYNLILTETLYKFQITLASLSTPAPYFKANPQMR